MHLKGSTGPSGGCEGLGACVPNCRSGGSRSTPAGNCRWISDKVVPARITTGQPRKTHVFRAGAEFLAEGLHGSGDSLNNGELYSQSGKRLLEVGGVPEERSSSTMPSAPLLKADWYDPELHPKIIEFCKHYGFSLLPTRPRQPRHKGKVERCVDYVQENALKGRTF